MIYAAAIVGSMVKGNGNAIKINGVISSTVLI